MKTSDNNYHRFGTVSDASAEDNQSDDGQALRRRKVKSPEPHLSSAHEASDEAPEESDLDNVEPVLSDKEVKEKDEEDYFSGKGESDSQFFRRYSSSKTTARGRLWKKRLTGKGIESHSPAVGDRVAAICVGHGIEVAMLLDCLRNRRRTISPNATMKIIGPPVMHDDAIRLRLAEGKREADLFYFSYGCFVSWGLTEDEELSEFWWLSQQRDVIEEPFEEKDLFKDVYTFRGYGEKTTMLRDVITLEKVEDGEQTALMKLAVSFGVAQSVKLEVFENQLDDLVTRSAFIPKDLAKHGKINADRTTLSKMTGEIMLQRNRVHLQHDFFDADMPDFFWEGKYENLEPVFKQTRKYLDICKRADATNRRLDILKEVFEMMDANLNIRHSTKLEMIVIWLIVLECALTLFEFFYSHYVWGQD